MPLSAVKSTKPKYLALAESLRRQICSGALKPGDRLPSQAELRARYGISQATMERLHAHLEQDGLIVRKQGLGTFVAHPPRPQRKGIIGVSGQGFLQDRESFYWSRILDGILAEATPAGFQILLVDRAHQDIVADKVDGIITNTPHHPIAVLPTAGLPYVALVTAVSTHDNVVANDFEGGWLLTRHLQSLGHERIAVLMNLGDEPSGRRVAGYRAAMQSAGIDVDERWVRMIPDLWPRFIDNGRAEITRWLAEDWDELKCTAVLVYNDQTAIGVIDGLGDAGLSVTGDVSVTGFDATGLFDYRPPLLTSIEVPLEEIGRQAMRLFLERIDGSDAPIRQVEIPVRLRLGESTSAVVEKRAAMTVA